MIGAGYMKFEKMGAILIMVEIGAVVRLFYRWSVKTAKGLLFSKLFAGQICRRTE